MKRTKKLGAMLLAAVMTLGLFAALPPVEASAATYDGVDTAEKLQAALMAGGDAVINITGSFTGYVNYPIYDERNRPISGIGISDRNVTINLNGFTINMTTHKLIINGGSFILNGPGTLNLSSMSGPAIEIRNGVLATTGGAEMNIDVSGKWFSIYAGGIMDITGSIKGGIPNSSVAFFATAGASVTVRGNIDGGFGAGSGANVTVYGNVTSSFWCVEAELGGTATVNGNVTATTQWSAVQASDGGIVTVNGNVTGARIGVQAQSGGKAYITGDITGDIVAGKYFLSAPTKVNVPFDGYYWDEYRDSEKGDDNGFGPSYVYKRQGAAEDDTPDAPASANIAEITAFVDRLYENVLGRYPDSDGLRSWVGRLVSKELGGGQVAEAFFFDKTYNEFMNRGLSQDEFLTIMYRTFMNRDPDPTGWEAWLDRMANQGYTWKDVFDGFVVSTEWGERCDAAGIRR